MAYPASRSMMMVMIAAVLMVVAMSMIASGSAMVVGLAHGIGGLRDLHYRYLRIREYMQLTIWWGMVSVRPSPSTTASPHPDVLDDSRVQAAVMSFALLADPTRVRLLWALRESEADVSSLAETAGCRATVASQHLSKLRFAGLVEGRRDGRRVVYRLRGAHVRNLLAEALFHADHQVSGEPVHD